MLFAPLWVRQGVSPLRFDGSAYRAVTKEAAQARWLSDVPADKQKDLIPPGVFDAWWNANMEADPVGAKWTPPVVRAPNGVLSTGVDGTPHYATGLPNPPPPFGQRGLPPSHTARIVPTRCHLRST